MSSKHVPPRVLAAAAARSAAAPGADAPPPGRTRITVDVSPAVDTLLGHYCDVTGQTRSSVVLGLLLAQLPAMAELADNLRRRSAQLIPAKR